MFSRHRSMFAVRQLRSLWAVCLWCFAPVAAFGQTSAGGNPPALNFHVVVTEDFLNRFVARQDMQPGPVHELLQDVRIDGEQCTYTDLKLDLLPSLDRGAAQFVLNGHVKSRTIGLSDQAVIHSLGHLRFRATKDLFFDGQAFATRRAVVVVQSNDQNLGIQTRFDGTPLEGLANLVAARMADQRKPQTDELARVRITQRVQPEFDAATDQKLADANDLLQTGLRDPLRKYDLLPVAQQVTTTDRHLHYAAALGSNESQPGPPRAALVTPHAVNLYIHESAFNGLIDRLKLKGLKTTDQELHRLKSLWGASAATGKDVKNVSFRGLSLNLETEIEFDAVRPMVVALENDRFVLRIRAALRPAGQELLPPVEIAVPQQLVPQDGGWKLTVGEIDVQPQNAGDRISDVATTAIREAIIASLPVLELPRELPIPNWPEGKPKLQLTAVRAADRWLAISLD